MLILLHPHRKLLLLLGVGGIQVSWVLLLNLKMMSGLFMEIFEKAEVNMHQ